MAHNHGPFRLPAIVGLSEFGGLMRKFLLCASLAFVPLWSCAWAGDRIDTDYRGYDVGILIFSTSTLKISSNFAFYYKKLGDIRDVKSTYGAGTIDCRCLGFWRAKISDPDYDTGYETGKVQIQHLQPGDYEVYTLAFNGSIVAASLHWYPTKPFSIPFTIKSGQATYIGNFARAPSLGTPLAAQLDAAGYFVVSDKRERDLEIARKKLPDLGPVAVSVTDVSQFGTPILMSHDPYE